MEEQTTQWPNEKVQKDKQQLSNTNRTKTRSYSTSGTRRFNLVTNPNYLSVVSSRMSKFPPSTRPGRLSTTKSRAYS